MVAVPAFWVARALLIALFRRRCRRWSCRLGNLGLLLGRAFENQVSKFAFLKMVLARGDGGMGVETGGGSGGQRLPSACGLLIVDM
jgi:hypothetical protein